MKISGFNLFRNDAKYQLLFLSLLLLTFFVRGQPSNISPNYHGLEIIRKSLSAHGGVKSTDSLKIAFKLFTPRHIDEGQSGTAYAPFDTYPYEREYLIDNASHRHIVKTKISISGGFTFGGVDFYDKGKGFSYDPVVKSFNEISGNPFETIVHLPQAHLTAALRNPEAIRLIGERMVEGLNCYELLALRGNKLQNIFIDKASNLINSIHYVQSMGVYGDGTCTIVFKNYKTLGEIVMPQTVTISTFNEVNGTVSNTFSLVDFTTEVNFSSKDFEVPEGFVKSDYSYRKPFELKTLAKDIYVIENVTRTTGRWSTNVLFSVFDDYVVVAEAPVTDGITQQIIEKIKDIAPGKPIKYLIQSHHHNDHLGGIRGYVAEGTSIITTKKNELLIKKISEAPFTIYPDVFAKRPNRPPPIIETMSERQRIIQDKNHKVVIYNIGPNPHAEDMLIVYFPNEKIMYQADMINHDVYPLNASTHDFVKKIRSLNLDITAMAGFHGKTLQSRKSIDSIFVASLVSQSIEWVNIPGGTFIMGSPLDEAGRGVDEVQHHVTLSPFRMTQYEITFEQFDSFCKATDRSLPDDLGWGRGKRPVLNVSWDDAVAFAQWIGGRLPTEAEWEYACRVGTTTPFFFGNCLSSSDANFRADRPYKKCKIDKSPRKTLPVGSLSPNSWGLFDMHGNVWEWCSDHDAPTTNHTITPYLTESQINPKGISSGPFRMRRGGGWNFDAADCRSANRGNDLPDGRDFPIGFRVVSPP